MKEAAEQKTGHFEKETEFPAVQVDNSVIFANKEINYPFKIREGESTNLGMFVCDEESHVEPYFHLGAESMHGRTGFVGRIKISDQQGNIYNDVELKGTGFIDIVFMGGGKEKIKVSAPQKRSGNDDAVWGIWERKKAERENKILEDLVKAGVRTNRIAGITKLNEIALPDGQKIGIEEAKKRKMVPERDDAVIGIRVYRMRERIHHNEEKQEKALNRAREIVEDELGQELSWQEYAEWFAETLGRNMAKIHNTGYWHGYPSSHNVTMACEIIDFGFGDGSKKIADLPEDKIPFTVLVDFDEGKTTALNALINEMKGLGLIKNDCEYYDRIYDRAYFGEVNGEFREIIKRGEQEVNQVKYIPWSPNQAG